MIVFNVASRYIYDTTPGFYCLLLDNEAVMNPTYTNVAQLSAWEVYGDVWPQGGIAFPYVSTEIVDIHDSLIRYGNIVVHPTVDIGPYRYGLVVHNSGGLVGYEDFGNDQYLPAGYDTGIGLAGNFLFKLINTQ